MTRNLWGEFDDETEEKPTLFNNYVQLSTKRAKLEEIQMDIQDAMTVPESDTETTLKMKNSLVTQTIEVMKQTEMLQSLIDTYSNKSGSSNYLLNPCQMIPEVDFPEENAADLVMDDKCQKPIWFIPSLDTPFSRGDPKLHPQLNSEICRTALRKAACGQLRVAGFTDTSESALVLFADAIEEFLKNFVQEIRNASNTNMNATFSNKNTCTDPDPHHYNVDRGVQIVCVERAYHVLTHSSLTQIHNFYKHNLVTRNRTEVAEFRSVKQEYDKLMQESQCMQKQDDDFHDQDFLNILQMTSTHPDDAMIASINNATTTMGVSNGNNSNIIVNEILHDLGGANGGDINAIIVNGNGPQGNGPQVHRIIENGLASSNGNSSSSSSSSTSLSILTHNGSYQS